MVLDQSASEEINLRKLADGRLDAAIINVNRIKTGAALIARAGLTGQVELAFAGGTLQSFIGFSRRHPRGLEARDQFNAGDQRIRADGTLTKLEASWIERTSGARRSPSSAPDKTR